jgi:hypothetical protein
LGEGFSWNIFSELTNVLKAVVMDDGTKRVAFVTMDTIGADSNIEKIGTLIFS